MMIGMYSLGLVREDSAPPISRATRSQRRTDSSEPNANREILPEAVFKGRHFQDEIISDRRFHACHESIPCS